MADSILALPDYITADQLAACDLTADDGLQLDPRGGVSRDVFLQWFEGISCQVAEKFLQ